MARELKELPPRPKGNPRWTKFATKWIDGFPDMNIKGATVLEFRGENRLGKTKGLNILRRFFYAEHDPELIAPGRDYAQAVLELTDAEQVVFTITRTITPTKTTGTVGASDGRVIKGQVETWIKTLTQAFLLDPLELLSADKKERENFFKEALPISYKGEEITPITGMPASDCDDTMFRSIQAGAETRRSDLNAQRDALDGMVTTMRESVIDAEDRNYTQEAEECQRELSLANENLASVKQKVTVGAAEKISNRRLALAAAIRDLEAAAAMDIKLVEESRDSDLVKVQNAAAPDLERMATQLGVLRQKASEQKKQEGVKLEVAKQACRLQAISQQAADAQRVVEKLRNLRSNKLANLPVTGVEYRDGKVFVDGEDLDTRLNTAEVYKVLLLIVQRVIGAGMVPFVITDRTESFDKKNRKWFYDAVHESGFQLACARTIDEGPLEVIAMTRNKDGVWFEESVASK